jgi:hypothetical protein
MRDTPRASMEEALALSGRPLEPVVRHDMEQRFGYDFSIARVHTDAKAAESAEALGAVAYTVGSNIVFGAGRYQPRLSSGGALLAHERAHVVQQSA